MRHITVFSGFCFVDYYDCTNNYFRMIKCIGSPVQWKQKEMSHYGAQEYMMAEQGLLEYVEMKRKGAKCERMCSQVRLLEQCRDIQNIANYFCSLWHVTKVVSGIHDDTNICFYNQSQDAQDMHTYEFCARVLTKWNLIFQCSQNMHTIEFCVKTLIRDILLSITSTIT